MDYFQVRYAPGWNWSAMLKMTKIKLKFIPDPDIYLFLENDKRGVISNRYSKAKNKCLKSHDLKQESKHIMYLDVNNLYVYAMSKFLLTSRFKWKDRS